MGIKQLIVFFGTMLLLPECRPGTISPNNYKVVCYFEHGTYRHYEVSFDIDDIDPSLCTHLISSFSPFENDKPIRIQYPYLDVNEAKTGDFLRFTNLKRNNSGLKTLLSVSLEDPVEFDKIVSSIESRKNFIDGYVELLKKYNFDGLDLIWVIFLSQKTPEEKEQFYSLLREMREEFNKHGLLITTALYGIKNIIDDLYDVPQVYPYFDFFNVQSFGYYLVPEDITLHETGLYPRPEEYVYNRQSNVNFTINYLISQGIPREKLILGMNFLRKHYLLRRKENHGLFEASQQHIRNNTLVYFRYDEICEKIQKENWTVVRDPYYMAPYAYHETDWISYDDIESVALKVEYAKNMKLGGAMVWSIENDDVKGNCHGERYPLLSAINKGFQADIKPMPILPQGTETVAQIRLDSYF